MAAARSRCSNDTAWAIALGVGLAVLRVTHHETVFWLVFVWGSSAAFGAAFGAVQASVVPRVAQTRQWLTTHWDLAPRYLAAGTSNSVATQLVTYGIGLLLGLAAVGAVQTASLLMGPYMVLIYGMGLVLLPEGVRILRVAPQRLRHLCVMTSVTFSALATAWGRRASDRAPDGVRAGAARRLVAADVSARAAPDALCRGVCHHQRRGTGPAGARCRGGGACRASLITSLALVALSVTGAALVGAVGAVSGGAVAMWVGAFVFWWELRTAMRTSPLVPSRAPSDRADQHEEVAESVEWTSGVSGGRRQPSLQG